jgi:hypothetical protein
MAIMVQMGELPDDLDRLGRALTHATSHAVARRQERVERQRRLVGCVLAGLLVFAAMAPNHLGPADRPEFLPLTTESAAAAVPCDIPRGQRFQANEACNPRSPQPQAAR